MKKQIQKNEFIHQGRASNCPCKSMTGRRCPDCNHLLTSSIEIVKVGKIEHNEIVCMVCGSRTSDEKRPREIILEVYDSNQVNISNF